LRGLTRMSYSPVESEDKMIGKLPFCLVSLAFGSHLLGDVINTNNTVDGVTLTRKLRCSFLQVLKACLLALVLLQRRGAERIRMLP
jgi:hypothetical protein